MRGFIAVVPSVLRSCSELTVGPRALTVLCQGVEKPGNLGAMLRTADGAPEPCARPFIEVGSKFYACETLLIF